MERGIESIAKALAGHLDLYSVRRVEGHLIAITQNESGNYVLAGDTYPVRNTIKRAGWTWNEMTRVYERPFVRKMFPRDLYEALDARPLDVLTRSEDRQALQEIAHVWADERSIKSSYMFGYKDVYEYARSTFVLHVIMQGKIAGKVGQFEVVSQYPFAQGEEGTIAIYKRIIE